MNHTDKGNACVCVCVKVHVFLGPVCDYSVAPVARYSPYWHKPVLSPGAMAHDFGANKRAPAAEYRLLTRVGVTFDSLSRAVTAVLKHHQWNNVIKVLATLYSTYLLIVIFIRHKAPRDRQEDRYIQTDNIKAPK